MKYKVEVYEGRCFIIYSCGRKTHTDVNGEYYVQILPLIINPHLLKTHNIDLSPDIIEQFKIKIGTDMSHRLLFDSSELANTFFHEYFIPQMMIYKMIGEQHV